MSQITDQSYSGQQLATESGFSLSEISESIMKLDVAITEIASASVEQSSGVEETWKNIAGVSTVSKQSDASAQELAANADQLNNEVLSLEQQVNPFKI